MKRSESLAAQREPRKRGASVTERRAAEDAEAAAAEEQRRRPQPKAKKRSTTAVVDENCVPGVSLLVLPDELLAHILRKCKLLSSYSHAAGVCTRLRVFVEDTCRLMLEEPNSWEVPATRGDLRPWSRLSSHMAHAPPLRLQRSVSGDVQAHRSPSRPRHLRLDVLPEWQRGARGAHDDRRAERPRRGGG